MKFKPLLGDVVVAAQITPDEVAEAAAAGIRAIINNRPDGEAPDQPDSATIAAAAASHGLAYRHIPVVSGRMSAGDVTAMEQALAELPRPVLAFCRSGTRSTHLWALAQPEGCDVGGIVAAAAAQGYDLTPLAPVLEGRRR